MKILVAEDDENSRVLQHTILEAAGYEVASVTDGREALEAIARAQPDLIISDIMMPEMDGFALCRAVKCDPTRAHIPFIFYTATYTSSADQRLAMELGAARFLIKPLETDALIAQVREVLAQGPATLAPALNLEAIDAMYAKALANKLDKKVLELSDVRAQLGKNEDDLQRVQECYRIAQKIAHVGSWDWNLDTGNFWWSDEIYVLLGVEPSEAMATGALLLSRIAEADRARFERALGLASERGVAFSMEHGVLGPGDMPRRMYSTAEIAAVNPETGKPRRIICAMRDITEQYQMEEDKGRMETCLRQAQKMEALGALASGIAHDFNNVLTGILGNAELLRMHFTPQSRDEHDCIEQIVGASRRATELVRQILTFSRRGEQVKCPTDLKIVVKEALKFIRAAIPTTIDIRTQLDASCPPVMADSTQVYQVIMNLCVNASHAMRPNPGTLEIILDQEQVDTWRDEAHAGLRAGRYVVLKVRDTGCGMDAATRERIFEPFFTTKEKGEGTGLGLTVVHGIILSHNGHITVASEAGKGTTFSIYLPALQQQAEIKAAAPKPLIHGQGERILLVDDERAATQVITVMLQELDYKVTSLNSSTEALSQFQKDPEGYSLMVTDLTMPGMDGLALSHAVAKQKPGFPIILCTGFSEVVAAPLAAESGVSTVLTKPFMMSDLATAIHKNLCKAK